MNSETPVPIVDPDSNEGDPSGNDDVREPLVYRCPAATSCPGRTMMSTQKTEAVILKSKRDHPV